MADRLISANALSRAMYHEAFEKDSEMQRWDSGCWIRYKMFENVLKAAPTIEAEPIKHGRWIFKNDNIAIPTGYYECSICGEGKLMNKGNYCPNCGADMRGGDAV